MNQNILKEIAGIADYPIINTHSHHLPDDEINGMNLTKLLSNSYVNWCGKPIPDGRLKSEITSWLIAANPSTTFWLMHGSYPWTADIAGLAHLYSNVWADLCWLPLISPTAAHRLINELIDVCNSDRVVWGCDTWTGEESYGARMAFIEVLCKVLHERVEAKLMYESDAIRYAKAVLYDNAAKWLTST